MNALAVLVTGQKGRVNARSLLCHLIADLLEILHLYGSALILLVPQFRVIVDVIADLFQFSTRGVDRLVNTGFHFLFVHDVLLQVLSFSGVYSVLQNDSRFKQLRVFSLSILCMDHSLCNT